MPVEPIDFLDCARRLRESQTGDEIDLRSAANRAYYALFHHAQELASKDLNYRSPKTGSVHYDLINALSGQGTQRKHRKLASMLRKGRQLRTKADYAQDVTFTKSESQSVLGLAAYGLKLQ